MNITTASDSLVATAADPIQFLLNDLDLYPVTFRLHSKHPTLNVELMVKEYRRFLVLKLAHRDEHAKLLSPSPLIDQVWHEHILETASYIPMCLAIGLWIHHDPDGANDGDAANRARRRDNTVDLYTARFGPMDQDVWDMDGVRRPYLPGRVPPAARALLIRLHSEIEEEGEGEGEGEDSSDDADEDRAAKKRRLAKLMPIELRADTGGYRSLVEVSESTQFRAIAHAFLEEHGLAIGCWRFIYNGDLLDADEERTAGELNIQDGDVVEVCKQQGGC